MSIRKYIRIPLFTGENLFNMYQDFVVGKDETDFSFFEPKYHYDIVDGHIVRSYDDEDESPYREINRLIKFETCPFCKVKMLKLGEKYQPGTLLACPACFYWGGRGTRDWGNGPFNYRGILGQYKIVENPDEVKLHEIINHLTHNYFDLPNLSPANAEKLLPNVIREVLDCEVKALGGVKDDGIDALAIRSDLTKMIIQIKWRERVKGSEAISVVREVGGTILARGIPNGMIVSTKSQFSKPAKEEAAIISSREIVGIGKLDIQLKDFNDLIDMFEIANKKIQDKLTVEEIIPVYSDKYCMFG